VLSKAQQDGYSIQRKENAMSIFISVMVASILIALLLAGANLLLESFNAEELSNMGVQQK
jgi:hypothetical protein